jgi:hypothetical protein
MAEIKVYRRFYLITSTVSGSATVEDYTLTDPYTVSANTYNVTQGQTLVEDDVPVIQDSTGVYYALLDGTLYNSNDEYDIIFDVNYTVSAPTRTLKTTFKLNPMLTPKGTLSYDIDQPMVIEINNNAIVTQVQVNNTTFEF